MLNALKWLFYLIAAAALIVVGGSFLLPAQGVVTRSIEMAAPPEKVFAIVGDLRRFNEFSPWAEMDTDIKYTFEGPESGLGQEMNWSSANPEIGQGTQTITRFEPPAFVASRLSHGPGSSPMGKAYSSFDLVPTTTGTNVSWTFTTDLQGIPAKWFGLLVERRIGPHYERGLARLKAVAEQPEPAEPPPEPSPAPESATPPPEADPAEADPLPEPAEPQAPAQ